MSRPAPARRFDKDIRDRPVSIAKITDGTSKTVAVGEAVFDVGRVGRTGPDGYARGEPRSGGTDGTGQRKDHWAIGSDSIGAPPKSATPVRPSARRAARQTCISLPKLLGIAMALILARLRGQARCDAEDESPAALTSLAVSIVLACKSPSPATILE